MSKPNHIPYAFVPFPRVLLDHRAALGLTANDILVLLGLMSFDRRPDGKHEVFPKIRTTPAVVDGKEIRRPGQLTARIGLKPTTINKSLKHLRKFDLSWVSGRQGWASTYFLAPVIAKVMDLEKAYTIRGSDGGEATGGRMDPQELAEAMADIMESGGVLIDERRLSAAERRRVNAEYQTRISYELVRRVQARFTWIWVSNNSNQTPELAHQLAQQEASTLSAHTIGKALHDAWIAGHDTPDALVKNATFRILVSVLGEQGAQRFETRAEAGSYRPATTGS